MRCQEMWIKSWRWSNCISTKELGYLTFIFRIEIYSCRRKVVWICSGCKYLLLKFHLVNRRIKWSICNFFSFTVWNSPWKESWVFISNIPCWEQIIICQDILIVEIVWNKCHLIIKFFISNIFNEQNGESFDKHKINEEVSYYTRNYGSGNFVISFELEFFGKLFNLFLFAFKDFHWSIMFKGTV